MSVALYVVYSAFYSSNILFSNLCILFPTVFSRHITFSDILSNTW